MAHTELDLRERRVIEDMLKAKMPVSKIAVEIGRHRATVYREIKRNLYFDDELPNLNGYYGMSAQRSEISGQSAHTTSQIGAALGPERARAQSAGDWMAP